MLTVDLVCDLRYTSAWNTKKRNTEDKLRRVNLGQLVAKRQAQTLLWFTLIFL